MTQDDIAKTITQEQGKTFADAKGDVFRGLEVRRRSPRVDLICCDHSSSILQVVEHATSTASLLMGETVENVSKNIDTYSYRQPLGVCAGICPFNFPAMIPLWVSE